MLYHLYVLSVGDMEVFVQTDEVYFRNCELEIHDRKLRSHFNATGGS